MTKEIAAIPKREADLREAFWDQVSHLPEGHKIKNCLQCGTCTGTCPVSYAMDITPRETIALFRAGHIEDILQSRTIWICASCYSCTVRCPMGIKITDTMYALKRLAMDRKIYPNRFPVHTLSKAFVDNVYRYGRNYELGLGIRYMMKAGIGKLIGNMGYGLSMIRRGRLGLLPKKIQRVNQVRAIIERANQFGE
ncbi:MAG TPA: 4Fe-4S dicluster domain-containing protein [Candidatus Acidoferrum sp.]|nr:4Fe-4S dicluster domain-containing protein [Candidatus Acidoferrum sp.]